MNATDQLLWAYMGLFLAAGFILSVVAGVR